MAVDGRIFRNQFFGFNKEDVISYFSKLNNDVERMVQSKDEQIQQLTAENCELRRENEEAVKRCGEFESERESVANAIIRADEAARSIIYSANTEAQAKKDELKVTYSAEVNKIAVIKEEVALLRKAAAEAIRRFESELTAIENKTLL